MLEHFCQCHVRKDGQHDSALLLFRLSRPSDLVFLALSLAIPPSSGMLTPFFLPACAREVSPQSRSILG